MNDIIMNMWKTKIWIIGLFLVVFSGCFEAEQTTQSNDSDAIDQSRSSSPGTSVQDAIILTDGFDYPVGKPDAKGYYNAQGFGKNEHLGDDWNGIRGGNSDLGDPIYATANGFVKFAEDIGGGWGKVIRINHHLPDGRIIESLYAHCDSMLVKSNVWVHKGDQIATIGNAGGQYYAHLHFEIRSDPDLGIGAGYSKSKTGYLDPTKFIEANP